MGNGSVSVCGSHFFFTFFAPRGFAENFAKTSCVSLLLKNVCLAILPLNQYKVERVLLCWVILNLRRWLQDV